jgi:DNA polymerase-3 subunit delta'
VPWANVLGHDGVVEELRQAAAHRRFPHALLFIGPEGVGKRTFALALAQALLCERSSEASLEPCGECPSCHQVTAGTHPDVLMVAKPEDRQDLPIKVIRDLCLDLGMKPMHGSRRLAIVDDADELNEESANAFLKTLEEPPPGSVLILLGTSAELQLETVVSRCRVVRFDPLPENDLVQILLDRKTVRDRTDALRLARLGEGSVSRALGLADPALGSFRRELIDELAGPQGFDAPLLAARIKTFVEEAGKESVVRRGRASLLVGELARFFRGVLWQTAGLEPPTPDHDDRKAVETLAARLEPEDVFLIADRCLLADFHIHRNVYMPLVLQSLTHDLAKLVNPRH